MKRSKFEGGWVLPIGPGRLLHTISLIIRALSLLSQWYTPISEMDIKQPVIKDKIKQLDDTISNKYGDGWD